MEIDTSVFRPAGYIEASIGNLSIALLIALPPHRACSRYASSSTGGRAHRAGHGPPLARRRRARPGLCGATINVMVLAGLDRGLVVIVDDAIAPVPTAVADRFRERRREATRRRTPSEIVTRGHRSRAAGRPIYATVIILLRARPGLLRAGASVSAFLPSLAIAYARGGARVDGGRAHRHSGAGRRCSCRDRPTEPSESPIIRPNPRSLRSRAELAPATAAAPGLLTGGVARWAWWSVIGALIVPSAGFAAAPPTFKDPDLLDPVGRRSRHVAPRDGPHRRARRAAELRAIPGVSNVGGHVGRAITLRPGRRTSTPASCGSPSTTTPTTTDGGRDQE